MTGDLVGAHTPTELANALAISVPGASQALQRLAYKGMLSKRRVGGRSIYETRGQHMENELFFIAQAVNWLSQAWAYVLSKDLSSEDLAVARWARDELEGIIAKESPHQHSGCSDLGTDLCRRYFQSNLSS
ncbi:MAG: helix-turn-helix transcriptional regulator [Nitrososphaerota archaeon]|nr:helix-turn-helix transcriptional regulator [Nitrososphaerota archaeon]